MSRRLAEDNGVHKNSSRGVLIIEVERKSTQKKVFLLDIPGLEGPERSRGGSPQPSTSTNWISSMTTSFMMHMRKDSSADPIWRNIDAVFPNEKVSFLLACLKRPYVYTNVYSTINYLHQFEPLRPNDWQPGGSRRPLTPVPQRRQQQNQAASSSSSSLQVPAIAVDASVPAMSLGTFEDIIREMRDLSVNKFNQLSAKVDEANAKADEANAKADEANAKVDEANAKADEANAKVDEANAKVDEARAEVNEANAKIEALNVEINKRELRHKAEVNNLKIQHDAEINRNRAETEAKLRELQTRHEAEIVRITNQHVAEIQNLRAELENYRKEHRQPAVSPRRASTPPQDLPADADPVEQQPEDGNRRSEAARESTSTNQSNSPRASSQDDYPDVTFDSSVASPDIPDSDEASSAGPLSPEPRDAEELPDRGQRSPHQLRSKSRVRDSTLFKYPNEKRNRPRPDASLSDDSSDDDTEEKRAMLRYLQLDDPQRPRIRVTEKLSFAVNDPDLYATINFAKLITRSGVPKKEWRCKKCKHPFQSSEMPAHIWLAEYKGSIICEKEGCNTECRTVPQMRKHLKTH
ncbi:uncharacterized protein LOC130673541 [Microplitis mediator]|uniref:uncharacterized protein LOC130673541 n=1 Tax=Microplitis mediator TaxID=375433 RepID=UPI00255618EE|nr:uncharacterized protein LOC130673541 [Microplitis mediator]XP_057334570.1 uncharacterized protein LOC130673541 [Microplitis mediator]XP_057334579.1 uncharacterized protein LOC130673541 [Microplitis mediator]